MSPPSLRMAFVTDGEPFDGASPEERALGGSETALVQVARSLVRRGHKVQVFCRCPRPGEYHGVTYRDSRALVQACPEERWDVVIVSRFLAALDLPFQAGLKVLWNHDLLVNPEPLANHLDDLDICLVLSRFHAQDFSRALPAIAPKLEITRNGLDLELLRRASQGVERQPGLVTYVSRPERGLKLLLEYIWPRLYQARPGLTLGICGYQVVDTPTSPAWRREYEEIQQLIHDAEGLRLLGSLAKADYYRHLASCECLLYPCTFPEISCLAALEAQALATPMVTSDAYALRESVVRPEFRVPGRPGSPEYVESYVKRALEVIDNPQQARDLASAAQNSVVATHDWDLIAQEWESLFLGWNQGKLASDFHAVAASLLVSGDRQAAAGVAGSALKSLGEAPPPPDPKEEELLDALAAMASPALGQAKARPVLGILAADQGRTAYALGQRLPGAKVLEIQAGEGLAGRLDLLLIRDRLEREPDPERLLEWAGQICAPEGHVLLALASGAWPLASAGYLTRLHDLGRDEISALLPGRPLNARYLPQGLIRLGRESYHLGRWLVLAPAQGPPPGRLDPQAPLRRARPAPARLLAEVSHAGLL